MLSFSHRDGTVEVAYNYVKLFVHGERRPLVVLRKARESVEMYRGNFFIEDEILEEVALTECVRSEELIRGINHSIMTFSKGTISFSLTFSEQDGRLIIRPSELPAGYNRLILRIEAEEDEHVWGCGEQFSYFNLRGKNFPLWTREQGVGRNKRTKITQLADRFDRAGGDYHTTFYPQPTFVSSRRYFFHADTNGYADYDFSDPDFHELTFWDVPRRIVISSKPTFLEIVQDISALLGRQRLLPDWVYDGIILGIQGGTETTLRKLERMQQAGVPVTAVWMQDWQGERYTSFGKRLRWNWQWDEKLYPNLDREIKRLNKEGVRVLGYINPYVLADHPLYNEAKELDLLGKREDGSVYLVDFGEFDAAIVDFTNEEAMIWYKEVIGRELIDFGLSGWMADFGEYLPTDVILSSGRSAMLEHNPWPGYWARINREAIDERKKSDEILFFMRAGSTASLAYCPMMWAGDQNVDWSEDDGLPSVLTSALSLAMSGMGLHHSDIGGYTTLLWMKRSKELLIRWAEHAAFTPLMRTHEGNRPKDNWQFDGDEETIAAIKVMTKVHVALKPYLADLVSENAEKGIPVMRPLLLHYDEERFYSMKDQYLLGPDLLVAPVLKKRARKREVVLPEGEWIHLFTKKAYAGGTHIIAAPLLQPPVFYRKGSPYTRIFETI